ncbi:DNA internalization-related competence protein ComEC/Rec2 [Sporosarcina sp. Te-1]|uniref:DNA internalization-related competence protein ComEC/Rec2 n=1 Tax=Sporosarcina sp. Te-1 TaxID=2818390 RepID=UPI001A9F6790|nr:DNA internalization-related competence protein ComEC/Rec2 [Sporosarcina sp. Te-1]QTD41642.1 DNA internalization-related competence protein ComEC/Rec2 [Sporosarcina sp. Te-1]
MIYIAIPVAVSAFAAYGPVYLLLLNICWIPVLLFVKRDFLTFTLAALAAVSSYFFISNFIPEPADGSFGTIEFTWTDSVKIDGGKIKGIAKTNLGERMYITYALQSEVEKNQFLLEHIPSYVFSAEGSIVDPQPASHPFSFAMSRYLKMNGASGVFEVVRISESRKSKGPLTKLSEWRYRAKQHIQQAFPESLRTEAEALLIGDRSGMDEDLSKAYRTLGITHLFAISGLHVGLMTYLIRLALIRLLVRVETVDTLLIVLLPCYAILAGGAPSVWRAVSVTVLLLLTASGKLNMRMDDALALSAIFFILLAPYVIFQPGFQLSYSAAIALVYSSGSILKGKPPLLISFLVTSITQIALYPILLFHFYELSISSFFVNLLYVPLYSVIILPMNVLLFVSSLLVPPIATFLFMIYTPLRSWMGSVTEFLAALPFQLWTPGRPEPMLAAFAVTCILLFFISLEKKWSWKRKILFLLLPIIMIQVKPIFNPTIAVTFLDVGQGDSIVIQMPFRKSVYVIDTGGTVSFGERNWRTPDRSFEVGRNIVVPFLKGQGITKVDKLILTHADSDHMEGADELIEELQVKEIHIPPESDQEQMMEPVVRLAMEKRIPIFQASEGIGWSIDGIHFLYLGPETGEYKGNDSSLVLLMVVEGLSFLFTGDMEEGGENRIISRYGNADFGKVILKAGHHGSRTSSTDDFIQFLLPQLSIVSAGRDNRYGHPHQEVMETFQNCGVPVLSTADSGSITITIQDGVYRITTMH